MSIRSTFSSLGRIIAAALRGAAKGAVWTSRKVLDTATGAFRVVFELVSPAAPVLPAQDAAEAYLDAAANVATPNVVHSPETVIRSADECIRRSDAILNPPLAKAVKAWAGSRLWGGDEYPEVDISGWPENLQIWLHGLSVDDLQRVALAPAARLEDHLRAQCEPDLMPGLRPVLTVEGARRDAEARREAVIRTLADDAGARRPGARRGGAFQPADEVQDEPAPPAFR